MSETHLDQKDLLGLRFLSKDQIQLILNQAKSLKELFARPIKQVPTLRGKTILNLFCEPSTRTKSSFDMATKLMGAGSMTISMNESSFKKGESIFDTVKNLQAMGVDGIIIRHKSGGVPHFVANHVDIPIINAGDGYNEHPTQGLLDIFTMQEKVGDLKGKRVLIWGDIKHSRVARSNIWGLTKLGAEVYVGGPPTLVPKEIQAMGATIVNDFELAIGAMDFLNVLRVQYERQDINYFPSLREYRSAYCITKERLKDAKKDLMILHPGPINRGAELSSEVADGPHNVILDQVTNGIAVRMAVLYLLLTKGK